jgi:hypothetical protein
VFGSWCQCHCLRIHPAVLSKEEVDARLQFTAVLRNLPSNYDAMDLCRIFSNCNGASLGIPRSSTYRPRPWAYFSFKSQECKDAAMEMQFSLKGRSLVWDQPENVKHFCNRCGAPDHLARSCTKFDDARGRSQTPKSLVRNYERFKPEGYKPVRSPSQSSSRRTNSSEQNASRSVSRSPSRSPSRRSALRSNIRSDGPSSSGFIPKKSVSYADSVSNHKDNDTASLAASMHSPQNRSTASQSQPARANKPYAISPQAFKDLCDEYQRVVAAIESLHKDYVDLVGRVTQHESRITALETVVKSQASIPTPIQPSQPSFDRAPQVSAFDHAQYLSPSVSQQQLSPQDGMPLNQAFGSYSPIPSVRPAPTSFYPTHQPPSNVAPLSASSPLQQEVTAMGGRFSEIQAVMLRMDSHLSALAPPDLSNRSQKDATQ